MNYEVKSAREAGINEIFFDKNTNKLSYKDKYRIVRPIGNGVTTNNFIQVNSYAEFNNLLLSENLIPGSWYKVPYRSVNFLNGYQNANNNNPGIFPSYKPREIYEGEEEILLVQAISTYEIANDAYSESYPGDVIQFAPYTNKIGVSFDISNGDTLPNSSTVSGFDLQWDGTNVYFNMPAGYPALFGHFFYLYCEFDDGTNQYYQDGTYEPLTPGVSNCQYPFTSDDPDYGSPKTMSRLQVVNNGTKILLLDLTQADVANYVSDTLYVDTVYALGNAYGWITKRNDTLKNVSIPFDFRGRKYRRYEREAFGLITDINYSSTGSTATDGTYYNITPANTGNGIGAQFQVQVVGGVVTDVRIMNQGMFYTSGEIRTISGSLIGGSSPADDVTITVGSVESNIGYYAIGTSMGNPLYGNLNVPADVYKDFKTFSDGYEFYNIDWSGMGGPNFDYYTGYSDNNLFIDCNTYNNVIKDFFNNNTINGNFSNNNISNDWGTNIITGDFQSNNVDSSSLFNIFNNIVSCNIKTNSYGNIVSGIIYDSNIGVNFYYNVISGEFNNNNIENAFQNNRIQDGFYGNTIGNGFYDNYIGREFKNNTIANFFNNNKINNGFKNNKIGTNVSTNTFGDVCLGNNIYGDFIQCSIADGFQYNIFTTPGPVFVTFLLSTFVYGNYNCQIFKRSDGSLQLSFIDGTNTIIYTGINA
jgi:hypothetical protein